MFPRAFLKGFSRIPSQTCTTVKENRGLQVAKSKFKQRVGMLTVQSSGYARRVSKGAGRIRLALGCFEPQGHRGILKGVPDASRQDQRSTRHRFKVLGGIA